MSGYRETPTVPAFASITEAQYREEIAAGMTITDEKTRRDTQRRIRAVAEGKR